MRFSKYIVLVSLLGAQLLSAQETFNIAYDNPFYINGGARAEGVIHSGETLIFNGVIVDTTISHVIGYLLITDNNGGILDSIELESPYPHLSIALGRWGNVTHVEDVFYMTVSHFNTSDSDDPERADSLVKMNMQGEVLWKKSLYVADFPYEKSIYRGVQSYGYDEEALASLERYKSLRTLLGAWEAEARPLDALTEEELLLLVPFSDESDETNMDHALLLILDDEEITDKIGIIESLLEGKETIHQRYFQIDLAIEYNDILRASELLNSIPEDIDLTSRKDQEYLDFQECYSTLIVLKGMVHPELNSLQEDGLFTIAFKHSTRASGLAQVILNDFAGYRFNEVLVDPEEVQKSNRAFSNNRPAVSLDMEVSLFPNPASSFV